MDTGDVVLHRPTGERWLVAYVQSEYVACCGWPLSMAKIEDCTLLIIATAPERLKLLQEMANMPGSDPRKTYALNRLEAAELVIPKEY